MIRTHVPGSARTVLIFRLGSLGDTVVALPSFRLIARSFPAARRVVLTNVPRSAQETDLDAVLAGTGLVHGYMHTIRPIEARPPRRGCVARSAPWRPMR